MTQCYQLDAQTNKVTMLHLKGLKPLLMLLKIGGAWPYTTAGEFQVSSKCNYAYSIILLMLNGLAFCLLTCFSGYTSIVKGAAESMAYVPAILFVLTACLNLLTLLKDQIRIKNYMSLLEDLLRFDNSNVSCDLTRYVKIIFVVFLVQSAVISTVNVLYHFDLMKGYTEFQEWINISLAIIAAILYLLVQVDSDGPSLLMVALTLTFRCKFNKLAADVAEDKNLSSRVDEHRKNHHKICQLVLQTDELFGKMAVMTIAASVLNTMVLLYISVEKSYSVFGTYYIYLAMFLFLSRGGMLIAVGLACGSMTEAVNQLIFYCN